MSHKDIDSFTITPATRRTPRRDLRPLSTESTTRARIPHPQTRKAKKLTMRDFVYVVKSELRSPYVGHPLVVPPSLLVDEVYRSKDRAAAKMREVVNAEIAFEIARGREEAPNPHTWTNAVLSDPKAESMQVTRADGMILRFFVDRIPLL